MIEAVVEDKEAVVEATTILLYFNRSSILLLVQLLQMCKRRTNMFRIYRCIYILPSLFKEVKDRSVDIVIYQYYLMLCRLNERLHEFISIKYLSFKQDTFHRWLVCPHKEVYLLLVCCEGGLYFLYLFLLCVKSIVHTLLQ